MEANGYLTNEKIKKKFISQFDLVNYAIKLAGNMIMTGRDARVKIDSQNKAMQVIGEILQDRDYFDEIIVEVEKTEERFSSAPSHEREEDSSASVTKEKKKSRKQAY